jgi:hypothetical protein
MEGAAALKPAATLELLPAAAPAAVTALLAAVVRGMRLLALQRTCHCRKQAMGSTPQCLLQAAVAVKLAAAAAVKLAAEAAEAVAAAAASRAAQTVLPVLLVLAIHGAELQQQQQEQQVMAVHQPPGA